MATLTTGWTTGWPVSFARGVDGALYYANGKNTPQRWDGLNASTTSTNAGIVAPATAVAAAGSGSGALTGVYSVYVRYLDKDGIPSNFNATPTSVTLAADAQVDYSSVPVSLEVNRVTKREIWRNTNGQEVTWYLDATIANNSSTTVSSTKTDAELRASSALRFLTADGYPNANRFTPPSKNYAVICNFQDRLWFACSTLYAERSTIMFSEAGEPESVPSCNALIMQEDGDIQTGLIAVGPYLYLTKSRHIYRITTAGDPRRDGAVVLLAQRGQFNNRCNSVVEGGVFFLDESGPWLLNGGQVSPIDDKVRDYFVDRVNWTNAATKFSVCKDATEEIVRFFVALDTDTTPKHNLSYDYRRNKWFLESYDYKVQASGEAVLGGRQRSLIAVGDTTATIYVPDSEDTGEASATWVPYSMKLGAYRLLPMESDNVRRIAIYFKPINNLSASLQLKVYLDGSATPVNSEINLDNEQGVIATAGSPVFTIALNNTLGCAFLRLDDHCDRDARTNRSIEFELYGTARFPTTIYAIDIDGVE